jgi:dihydrofolate reductase
MRLVVTEFISLDGVIEGPGPDDPYKNAGWSMPYWSDEIGKFKLEELFGSDAFLLGRITYQGFAAAWPSRTDKAGFADRMNKLPKYVASTSLKEADWNNSTILNDRLFESVSRLKQQPGRDILIAGSGKLAQSQMQAGLIDEYRLLVYPIVLGSGKRLFEGGDRIGLRLVETKEYTSGVVLLRYIPDFAKSEYLEKSVSV